MKEKILTTIQSLFQQWSEGEPFCCRPGCSCCCTGNVTVTTPEARRIFDHFLAKNKLDQLAAKLATPKTTPAPLQTTNEFVADILNGRQPPSAPLQGRERCPFLENDLCSIYEVRPFHCLCFASTTPCNANTSATVSDTYMDGSTMVLQLIEHLGQFAPWGLLTDTLTVLCGRENLPELGEALGEGEYAKAQARIRTAQPIPGFVLPEQGHDHLTALLQTILSARIDHRSIEEIFNGGCRSQ